MVGEISLGRVVVASQKLGPVRSYNIKGNHIGSTVGETLCYTQTNILLLSYKDNPIFEVLIRYYNEAKNHSD